MRTIGELARGEARALHPLVLLARSKHDLPAGASALPYGKDAAGASIVVGVVVALEVVFLVLGVVGHGVIDPLGAARWPVLALSLYAVLRLVAHSVAERTHPHYIDADQLTLRLGRAVVATIPLGQIRHVQARVREQESERRLSLGREDGSTNLDIALTGPIAYRLPWQRRVREAAGISLAVDEPGRAIATLRDHGLIVVASP
ncbi:MAG: hypothetical protein M9923_12445 [Phycicoccus sp.]|uniref:hypothetical protein n=1 Tax=Phycicoccus sp. TaxID=1902410 RepID=UPI002585C406|nr:hypothetical protein [Phycicoccus sp.]MCO5304000.1 hypothetical protein [Phycicoccus sp.]